jgi:hypothetical protein
VNKKNHQHYPDQMALLNRLVQYKHRFANLMRHHRLNRHRHPKRQQLSHC